MCYLGGTLALGAHNGLDESHLERGKKLTNTCFESYRRMPTGLSPEICYFNLAPGTKEDIIVKVRVSKPKTDERLGPNSSCIRFPQVMSHWQETRAKIIHALSCCKQNGIKWRTAPYSCSQHVSKQRPMIRGFFLLGKSSQLVALSLPW